MKKSDRLTDFNRISFPKKERTFYLSSEDKAYKRAKKREEKRKKKGLKNYNKQVEAIEKQGGKWTYEGE